MSSGQIALLGAIAGATIFLGLPLGRLKTPMPRLKTALNATATGILIFLFWDVTSHACAPIDEALSGHSLAHAARSGAVLAVPLGVGLLGLVWVDQFTQRRVRPPVDGPGAATLDQVQVPLWRDTAGRAAPIVRGRVGVDHF